ncbi:hypothetical protein [Alteromonas gracilis]|uniref:hypothetical protein n=1 Tax=Alteromonas gracilis TaxID=1479524 RepID=UPI003735ED98
MDILSDDGTQLAERISNWEDIFSRPRYQKDVDHDAVQLVRILGHYTMEEVGSCGLSNCHQPHKKGFLVLCKPQNGLANHFETNIGNQCGKNIFGVTFDEQTKNYNIERNTILYRDSLVDAICKVDDFRQRVHVLLKDEGGEAAYARVRNAIKIRGIDRSLVSKLERRAKNGDVEVFLRIAATKRDIDLEESRMGRKLSAEELEDLTQHESLGRISGVRAVTNYEKIKSELKVELPQLLDELDELKPEELLYNDLKSWSKRIGDLDSRFREVEKCIDDCKRFSVASNIEFINANKEWI